MTEEKKELVELTNSMPTDVTEWTIEQTENYKRNLKFLFENGVLPKRYLDENGKITEEKLNQAIAVIAFGLSHHIPASLALSRTMVVNGEITLWGDALLAIVYASGLLEYKEEEFDESTQTAICWVKRKDMSRPEKRTFSVADAKTAGLWGRNVWAKYPRDMLAAKARNRAIKEVFPDVVSGMTITEDAVEIQSTNVPTKYSTILEAPITTVVNKEQQAVIEDVTPELEYTPVDAFREMIEQATTSEELVEVYTRNKTNIKPSDSSVILDMFKKKKLELSKNQ